jgi:hypothetical protein
VGNEHEATANSRSGEGGEVACRRGDAPASNVPQSNPSYISVRL